MFALIDGVESALYEKLVRENYQGEGVIIDAGCFLGGSTNALCRGLRAVALNPAHNRKVIAIDRFVVDEQYLLEELSRRSIDVRLGESFLDIFLRSIRDNLDLVEVRAGELLKVGRVDSPIEVLTIDLAKSPSLNAYVLRHWFRRLIPGRSIVIHQDLHSPYFPWIASTMGFLLDYFDILVPKAEETCVFRLKSTIPEAALAKAAALNPFSNEALSNLAVLKNGLGSTNTSSLKLMEFYVLLRLGAREAAFEIVRNLEAAEHPGDIKWEKWLAQAIQHIDPQRALTFPFIGVVAKGLC